ncbi:AMP-binding protein [Streptomyces rapamycinicus]|uniref:AMP-dependent synthetase/ligase domain-containing protein n=2 Tax=Streptomyces rapamycinicus TaxID=1226757 RepID=A0A0A0N8S2_STRRN|nr:AMP-binding protein [Streptomyces rapamycinicus]AGP53586.1 hypothetical protein M271_09875 [Streptomyces rapamycinicus NRRL 5491]MBB4781066.1 non-ribosomal peptide synthetase component F [Streptomyces rapamycinicus]RLV74288.1 hypothetical protein D3C57_133720 [Streptomyces rapamycinicus NRRL 5491]UTO61726.1 AMP-binding protein [Streptomyces rapamycinicus]UTP29679.1 AMP-binding protein [Streptomyces rapamycinicus NRRL 5491]
MIADQMVAGRSPEVAVGPRPNVHPPRTAGQTLDGAFVAAALRRPGAVAVRDDHGLLTYQGADTQAGQLGSLLVRGGVQLGDPVIVHCDDHRQSLVAQLAVLKAGGVCVPLPPGTADSRLAAVAALTGASAVLCSRSTLDQWRHRSALALDDPRTSRLTAAHRVERALPRSTPHEAAHLLVSGTGRAVTGQLADHVAWHLALAGRTRATGPLVRHVFVSGPPGTPHALSALWWALACGGTLHTLPRPGAEVPPVTNTGAVVSSPEEYAESVAALRLRPRLVQLVGSAVAGELAARHFAALPDARLRAEFAPGGLFPWAVRDFTPQEAAEDERVIGRPAARVRVRVADREHRALPAWRTGELCAGGRALPFDTLHAPGRAAPPAGHPVLLRSGIPGRRRADGLLELVDPPGPDG